MEAQHGEATGPLTLPHGPHGLPRHVVRGSQRRRIIEATARLVSEHGYASTSVADISTLAGVSRATFYEQFDNKEQLFLACYQAGSNTQRTQVELALSRAPDPRRQARDAIVAYLGMLETDEDFARAFFVEAQIATALTRERFLTNQDGYANLVSEWHRAVRVSRPELPIVSLIVWAGPVAGIAYLVTQHIRGHGVTDLVHELTEPSLHLILAVAGIPPQAPPSQQSS